MPARRTHALTALLLGLTLTAGCSAAATPDTGDDGSGTTTATPSPATSGSSTTAGSSTTTASSTSAGLVATHEEESDYAWDEASEVAIVLADGGTTGSGGVFVSGSVVTITAAGTYRLSGSLSDGQVIVDTDADGVVRLVLDGVDIASSTTSPLSVINAEKVVVLLADGSQNTLTDAATYQFASADEDEPNAALFSAADLTIAGDGSLTVTGSFNDGIASKDGLLIAGGTVAVTAADDGIRGRDYLVVSGGALTVSAGGDALKADTTEDATLGYVAITGGALDLTAGTDAIDAVTTAAVDGGTLAIAAGDDAIHSDTRLEVHGGTIAISRSYEGLEATQIVISGGSIDIVAEDDGLNVAGGNDGSAVDGAGDRGAPGGGGPGGEVATAGYYVEMSGGTLVIDAGGDGFDSNGSATVTGGTIVVNGPTSNGNGAIDVNGEFLLSDAVLVAAGSAGMAETPSATSAQAYLNLQFNAGQAAGTVVTIRATDGTAIAAFVAEKSFQSLVFSSPDLVPGASYEVLVGGTVSGESLGGLYLGVDSSGGTSLGSVTAVAG